MEVAVHIGSLGANDAPASCTRVTCGADCVVVVGLCGRLRAWRRQPAGGESWQLMLDESSRYELANSRFSSHPYRFLSPIAADGRFAVATTVAGGIVDVWCTRTWQRVQVVDPADSEDDRKEREARGVLKLRAEHSCLALAHGHLATGSREGHVRLWRAESSSRATDGELVRRFGTFSGDHGPLADVVLTPHLVLGIYRASSGLIDGNEYAGGQGVCAWSLRHGTLIWKHAPKMAVPVVGALRCGDRTRLPASPSARPGRTAHSRPTTMTPHPAC